MRALKQCDRTEICKRIHGVCHCGPTGQRLQKIMLSTLSIGTCGQSNMALCVAAAGAACLPAPALYHSSNYHQSSYSDPSACFSFASRVPHAAYHADLTPTLKAGHEEDAALATGRRMVMPFKKKSQKNRIQGNMPTARQP